MAPILCALQILYGEDSDNDKIANRYINASNIAANPIVSVRIALLVSTNENIGTVDNNTYALLNTPILGPIKDNLLRRVFIRTIILRNS